MFGLMVAQAETTRKPIFPPSIRSVLISQSIITIFFLIKMYPLTLNNVPQTAVHLVYSQNPTKSSVIGTDFARGARF